MHAIVEKAIIVNQKPNPDYGKDDDSQYVYEVRKAKNCLQYGIGETITKLQILKLINHNINVIIKK